MRQVTLDCFLRLRRSGRVVCILHEVNHERLQLMLSGNSAFKDTPDKCSQSIEKAQNMCVG